MIECIDRFLIRMGFDANELLNTPHRKHLYWGNIVMAGVATMFTVLVLID